jgi:hypothetical protein
VFGGRDGEGKRFSADMIKISEDKVRHIAALPEQMAS